MQIKTVLCPIDFSTLSDDELGMAIEICETFGAHLVLHHNLAHAAPGLHKAWEWEEEHELAPEHKEAIDEPEARRRLDGLLARIPEGISAEARTSRGPIGLVLLYLVEEISADLVLLGSHGWSSEEHASLSERLIERCPCPILTLREGLGEGCSLRLRRGNGAEPAPVLVPTDFSRGSCRAVDYALCLAEAVPLKLHLLHVRPRHDGGGARQTEVKLLDLVPTEMLPLVECHTTVGGVSDEILAQARELDAELIVMGEHARDFPNRYFTHNTSKELLHRARCPVWFVPPGAEG